MKHSTYLLLAMIIGLGGCAASQTPPADLASRVPTIELGQPAPEGDDYILLVRAGQDVPVRLTVGGAFLAQEGRSDTTVRVREDVYLYKRWSSLDGKTWERGAFQLLMSAGMGPEGATVNVKVNRDD